MGERVAFVGLGVMGYPMTAWLRRAGHEVTVFNRTTAMAQAWAEDGGEGRCDAGRRRGGRRPGLHLRRG